MAFHIIFLISACSVPITSLLVLFICALFVLNFNGLHLIFLSFQCLFFPFYSILLFFSKKNVFLIFFGLKLYPIIKILEKKIVSYKLPSFIIIQ